MSVRNYETVVGAIKALNESITTCTVSNSGHQPYDLPISQLIRFEKTRGFEHEFNAADQQLAGRYRYVSVASGTPAQYWLSDARLKHGCMTTAGGVSPRVARRVFSTQTVRERPPPVRKPPPPPRRSPSIAVRVASVPIVDDVLSRIADLTTTGEEHNRKIENEQARLQKQQTREIIEKGPWWDKFRSIELRAKNEFPSLYDGPPTAAAYFNILKKQNRNEGLQRLTNAYDKTERIIQRYIKKSKDWDNAVASFKQKMEKTLATARERGRLDFKMEQYLIKSGIRSFKEEVDRLSNELLHARTQFADYWYNHELNRWKQNLIETQLDDTLAVYDALKEDGGIHHQTNIRFREVALQSETIAKLLRRLETDITGNGPRHSPFMATYASMLSIPYYSWFESHFMSDGHYWRKTNRLGLMAVRMPELVKHSLIELEVNAFENRIKDNLTEMHYLMKALGNKRWSDKRRVTRIRANEALAAYQHNINRVIADYTDLTSQGLIMLNPAMSLTTDLLKYAALKPFYAYVSTLQTTESALRYVTAVFKRMNQDVEGSSARIEWRTNVMRWLTEQSEAEKLPTRRLLHDLTTLTYAINTRILEADWTQEPEWPFLRRLSTKMAEKARNELKEIDAFGKLSVPTVYSAQDNSEKLIDPFRMKGRNMLYPPKNTFPVEYVASEPGIVKALNELTHSKVLGIELLRNPDAPFPIYAAIANIEKVIILECVQSDHFYSNKGRFRDSLFGKILEDPDIIKIFRNAEVLDSIKVGKFSSPKSVVSLDYGKSVRRKLPKELWPEVFLHHQFQKSVPSFLSDLAFAPAFNLVTFLNAATPDRVSGLERNFRANILGARERLRCMVAENSETGLELGNITWNSEESSEVLGTSVWRRRSQWHRDIAAITSENATKDLEKAYPQWEMSDINKYSDALAAYYMFTTFGKDLTEIKDLLHLDDPANSILSAVQNLQNLNIILHPKDHERIQQTTKIRSQVDATPVVLKALSDHERQIQIASQTGGETQTQIIRTILTDVKPEVLENKFAFSGSRSILIPLNNVCAVESSDTSVTKPEKISDESQSLSKPVTRTETEVKPGFKKEKAVSRIAARRKSARKDELSAVPKPDNQGITRFRLITGERVSPSEISKTTVVRRVAAEKESAAALALRPTIKSAIRHMNSHIPSKHTLEVYKKERRDTKRPSSSRRRRQAGAEGQKKVHLAPKARPEEFVKPPKVKPEAVAVGSTSWKAMGLKLFGWK